MATTKPAKAAWSLLALLLDVVVVAAAFAVASARSAGVVVAAPESLVSVALSSS